MLPFDLNHTFPVRACRCSWRRWTPTGITSLNWTRLAHIWSISARNRMWCWSRTCCSACKAAGRSWCSGQLSEDVCWMMPGRGQNRYCMCPYSSKSVKHAFFTTVITRQLWKYIKPVSCSVRSLLAHFHSCEPLNLIMWMLNRTGW